MPDNAQREPGFSEFEADNLTQYRPISRAALAALAAGVLSITAVVSPAMLWLPIVSVLLAIVALRIVAASQDEVLGRKTAVLGLLLGTLFGAWGLTKFLTYQHSLYQQARVHAEAWIDLVQEGRLHEAHQLHLMQRDREMPGVSLQTHYEQNVDSRDALQAFFAKPPLDAIVTLGRRGQVRFLGNEGTSVYDMMGGKVHLVKLRFALDREVDGALKSTPFILAIGRGRFRDAPEARWNVQEVTPVGSE
jgi:hypothetical protein